MTTLLHPPPPPSYHEGQLLILMPFESIPTPQNIYGIFADVRRTTVVKHPTTGVWIYKTTVVPDGINADANMAPPWKQHGPVPCVVVEGPKHEERSLALQHYVVMVDEGIFLFVHQGELIDPTDPTVAWILEKMLEENS